MSRLNFSRLQSSNSGKHFKTGPLAIQEKLSLSFVCHRPFPSAMLREIDNEARQARELEQRVMTIRLATSDFTGDAVEHRKS